jgi:hypothetical protein
LSGRPTDGYTGVGMLFSRDGLGIFFLRGGLGPPKIGSKKNFSRRTFFKKI